MNDLFSAAGVVSSILEFEAALASALAEEGLAPASEAEAVVQACGDGVDDPESILATTWEAGTPILALRAEVTATLDAEAARWFHFGATTQDAVDTALMLQVDRGIALIDADLMSMAQRLRELTVEFRDQPHMGRTFIQDARPMTFGLRTAGWLNTILEHHEASQSLRNVLPVQLGGSNGTRSDYGDSSRTVVGALAHHLGLADSPVVWHGDRSVVLSAAQYVERISRTMAKIATDIAYLASSGVSEVTIRSGGSSSMPDKRNPVDSIRAIAAASACSGAVSMLTGAPAQELDRGVGGWHIEWVAMPLALCTTAAAVDAMRTCLVSLEVNREAMTSAVSDGESVPSATRQIESVLERAAAALED